MRRVLNFLRDYTLFSIAVFAVVAGLVLEASRQHTAAHWLLGSVYLAAVTIPLWRVWQAIRAGTYGIDILTSTAIITAVLLHQYWTAAVVVLVLGASDILERFAQRQAKKELDGLLKRPPRKAHVLRKGKLIDARVSELQVNDKIIIQAGELVPVDAVIIEGSADFDESALIGDSKPHFRQIGDHLLSSSINLGGPVTAKVLATAEDSQYHRITKLVRGAAATQAPFAQLTARYSLPFTFMVYTLATGMWFLSGQAIRFLEVIVVATPYPFLVAAPIALMGGMARASRYGIIAKTGTAWERLAGTKTMAFDKSGTLTSGEPVVDRVLAFSPFTKNEVLGLAASLEQASNHVVAQAIVAGARTQQIKLDKAKHISETPSRGVRAMLKGREILVGRLSFLTDQAVTLPAKADNAKDTVVYVAVDGQLAGTITLKDIVRPEAAFALKRLHALGVHETLLLTGDSQAAAQVVAKTLAITHVHAELLPADKIRLLEQVKLRPLAFVGDGINDTPALTAATIGIALGARSSPAASEAADIVILPHDLARVATAMAIARRTFHIARQGLFVGLILSLLLMITFATGKLPPLDGAIIQGVIDMIVIIIALRSRMITVKN